MRAAFAGFAFSVMLALGCNGNVGDPVTVGGPGDPSRPGGGGGGYGDDPLPSDPTRPEATACDTFMPSSPQVYGNKVKTLLVGSALTDVELRAIASDPSSLGNFIDQWLATPEAQQKLLRFFATAFQQEDWEDDGLTMQWDEDRANTGNLPGTRTAIFGLLRRNFEESFARTVLQIIEEGRPFNEVVTTRQFMMTTAMMAALAYQSERHTNDAGRSTYGALATRVTRATFTTASIPASRALNPASADFMKFTATDPRVVPSCAGTQISDTSANAPRTAFRAMFGYFTRIGPDGCRGEANVRGDALLQESDFDDWRLVTVRQPGATETGTQFYELEAIRASDELVVKTPRVGFFTTPAFFATWPTNEDNMARVTTNQTLIVAYGMSIDGSDTIVPVFPEALDGEHADPTTVCWGCHVTLDPMKQFFRRDYTFTYSDQRDAEARALRAAFQFAGVEETGEDIFEFADIVANHPVFPRAWTQKMCFYANSTECPRGEELDRVVAAFEGSGLDFRVLLRELLSSPLVTSAECIENGTGDNASIARARHFCRSLSTRLDLQDPCGIELRTPTALGRRNAPLVTTIPDDTFSRGSEDPLTLSDVNLFVRSTYERVCSNVAVEVVGSGKQFDPASSDVAIAQMVERLMGLAPSDTRHDAARALLGEHYTAAQAEGATTAVALQSTFVLACMSPSVVGVGL